jgi:UDP-sulfoquinovose synthase
VQIFNQMTEVHRVIHLAELVARLTGVEIDLVDNPRKEAAANDLVVERRHLLDLGLEPVTLATDLLHEVMDVAVRHRDRIDVDRIPCRSRWVRGPEAAPAPV